ncbi:hypothetical protein MLD38_002175 [Melastoma candidum]|uniref:Uncharacterized protein n=1 Tax=Melastoma candidum TaxID=119954 RepID=A0ACB9SJK1_9MYRT|nr:hypothetical protein MLD38_002175 [Melastoma candidum]
MGITKQPSYAEPPKRRKKKGRPSLLDIQKRLLKQQKSQSPPSHRINPNPSPTDQNHLNTPSDDDNERLPKKYRPFLGMDGDDPNYNSGLDGREVLKIPAVDLVGGWGRGVKGIKFWAGVGRE